MIGNYSLKPSWRHESIFPNPAAPLAIAAIIVVLSKNKSALKSQNHGITEW